MSSLSNCSSCLSGVGGRLGSRVGAGVFSSCRRHPSMTPVVTTGTPPTPLLGGSRRSLDLPRCTSRGLSLRFGRRQSPQPVIHRLLSGRVSVPGIQSDRPVWTGSRRSPSTNSLSSSLSEVATRCHPYVPRPQTDHVHSQHTGRNFLPIPDRFASTSPSLRSLDP